MGGDQRVAPPSAIGDQSEGGRRRSEEALLSLQVLLEQLENLLQQGCLTGRTGFST